MSRVGWLVVLAGLVAGCGAAPEPVRASEGERACEPVSRQSTVLLSEEQLVASGVRIGRATRGTLTGAMVVPAVVHLDPTRTAHVSALVTGRLRSVEARLGDPVHAGQVLAELASADAGDLAAAIAQARARVVVAEAASVRLEALGATGVSSQRALLESQAERDRARAELTGLTQRRGVVGARGGQRVSLIAPLDGTVVEVHAVPGEIVAAGEALFTVSDTHHVWAIGRAPELILQDLREGLPATLRLRAYPAEHFDGTIALLSPMLDETSRTLDVRVELDDPSDRLRAGLFGSLALGDTAGQAIVVPEDALARLDGGDVVFVPGDAPRSFVAHAVAIGHRSGGLAEIASGLEDGDAIVVVGTFILKSELLRAELQEDD